MQINKQQKELIKIYIVLFALIYVIINWDNVSWIFNYRELSGLAYDFFNPYQESSLLVSANNMTINSNIVNPVNAEVAPADIQKIYPYSDKDNSLEIPSVNLTTAVVIGESTSAEALTKNLDSGAVYYPGSVLPGEKGQIIILGHSAPPNWPHIKHDWVFSDLGKLNTGDEIILYFNNRQYIYHVTRKDIIKKGQDILADGSNPKNVLVLVSCWPPGKNYQRIAVQAELIN